MAGGGRGIPSETQKNPLHLLSHFFPRYLLSLSLSDSDSDEKELRSSFLFNGFKPTPNFPIVSQQMDFQLESCPCCYPRYLCSALSKKMHPANGKKLKWRCSKDFPLLCKWRERESEKVERLHTGEKEHVNRQGERFDSPYEQLIVQEHTDLRGGLGRGGGQA